jgi:hypothetical protein
MVRNEKLWAEIAAKLAELVDRDGVEFLAALDGLQAQLFLEVSIDDISGEAVLALRNNTILDDAGAPTVAALVISKSIYTRLSREKENAVKTLVKRHGKRTFDRLVTRSRPVEATGHFEILAARS